MSAIETITMPAGFAERTLGGIAAELPGATAVFRAAKLDYCCGGRTTLRDAAAARSLSLDDLVGKLEDLAAGAGPAEAPPETEALIAFIVARYHETHKRELPELIRLATRVEAVHRDHPAVPAGLAELLQRVLGELTVHMQKEELILFPAMGNGGEMRLTRAIAAMTDEHEEHGAQLRTLHRLTGDFASPEGACATWRALYAGLGKFADDLVDHIHVENNVLFPRFAAQA